MRFKLANFTQDGAARTIWYTPDFVSLEWNGGLPGVNHLEQVAWEVKGHWREGGALPASSSRPASTHSSLWLSREKGVSGDTRSLDSDDRQE